MGKKKIIFIFIAFVALMYFMITFAGPSDNETVATRLVKFIDGYDNSTISEQNVEVGYDAEVPEDPYHEDNIFIGWYLNDSDELVEDFTNILDDMEVVATYAADLNNNGIRDDEETVQTPVVVEDIQVPVVAEETVPVVVEPAPAVEVFDLNFYKQTVKANLDLYVSNITFDEEYTPNVTDVVNNGKNLIDAATTREEVDKAFNDTKVLIDDLADAQDLKNAKADAIKELNEYVDLDDYREAEQLIITTIIEEKAKEINEALTKEEVNEILDNAKELIDEVVTDAELTAKELAAAKEAAIKSLNEYKETIEFNDENDVKADELVLVGTEAITDSTTIEEVNEALEEAKSTLDELKAAQDLQDAKDQAIEELNNYVDLNDYRYAEQEQIKLIIENGINNINSSTTISEVAIALQNAKNAIDAIKTNAELTEEEDREFQTTSRFDLTFDTYTKTEYTPRQQCRKIFGRNVCVDIPAWTDVEYPKLNIEGKNNYVLGFIPDIDILTVKYDNEEVYNDIYLWKNSSVNKDIDITNVETVTIKYMVLGDGRFAGTYVATYSIDYNNRSTRMLSNVKQ